MSHGARLKEIWGNLIMISAVDGDALFGDMNYVQYTRLRCMSQTVYSIAI